MKESDGSKAKVWRSSLREAHCVLGHTALVERSVTECSPAHLPNPLNAAAAACCCRASDFPGLMFGCSPAIPYTRQLGEKQ